MSPSWSLERRILWSLSDAAGDVLEGFSAGGTWLGAVFSGFLSEGLNGSNKTNSMMIKDSLKQDFMEKDALVFKMAESRNATTRS